MRTLGPVTADPTATPPRVGGSPTTRAIAWAAAAYPVGALVWVVGAAGSRAFDTSDNIGEWGSELASAAPWIATLAAAAGFVVVPLLMLELLLWRVVVARVPSLEQDRLAMMQSAALLAIPWMLLLPIDGTGPAILAYVSALAGMTLPRLVTRRLGPGALLRHD